MSEIRQSPERIFGIFNQAGFNLDGLEKNIEKEVAEGDIRSIDPAQFFIHLLGLTVFPFIMEPMVRHIFEMDEPRF